MNFAKWFVSAGILFAATVQAQDIENKVSKNYNVWSVELNAGMNNAVTPFGTGYSASNESKFFSATVNHFDLGVRYMITSKFGLKLDVANDKIANASGSSSLPFETQQNRLGLQGIFNVSKMMGFEEFTKSIGLLIHAGVQASLLTPKTGVNKNAIDKNGGIMFGVTPQVKLYNNLALTVDFTVISNQRQHFAWDGSASEKSNNLNGQMLNTSFGLIYSFGKNENHADWFIPEVVKEDNKDLTKRLDAIEEEMNDTDRDGIVDHLDIENNTPTGVAVDSKGRFIDVNKNGVPDEMESDKTTGLSFLGRSEETNSAEPNSASGNGSNASNASKYVDALKSLVESGYVNVYFDINEDVPNSGSTNNVFQIISYLKTNPESSIILSGFADVRGDEHFNQELSKRRADNVRNIFIDSGIDANRIKTNPQGVDRNSPTSKTGLDLARRVSVQLIK